MRRLGIATVVMVGLVCAGGSAQSANDEQQLAGLVTKWAAARNANDAEQMRALFHPQVDHVRVTTGEVIATDADQLVGWFATGFKGDGKGTTVQVSRQRARALSPTLGVVDYAMTMARPDGSRLLSTAVTFFCARQGSEWKVAAVRFGSPVDPALDPAPK
ncbi:MAG: SgcJ/EcaC family oxidoreductase [Acidobacteria bacterium]|nr:SgcJ/EcaC family oxidoreductase [Acidobacteriota bacterium]